MSKPLKLKVKSTAVLNTSTSKKREREIDDGPPGERRKERKVEERERKAVLARPVHDIAGSQLATSLAAAENPLAAVADWQTEHGLDNAHFPRIPAVMLDLFEEFELPRSGIYVQFLGKLRATLIERVEQLGEISSSNSRSSSLRITDENDISASELRRKTMDKLLEQSFPYIRYEEMRDVVFSVLRRHPDVPPIYYNTIAKYPDLYEASPLDIKRCVWAINSETFKNEVLRVLEQGLRVTSVRDLCEEWRFAVASDDSTSVFSSAKSIVYPQERRSQWQLLCDLMEMIGTAAPLYNIAVELLKKLFLRTRNAMFCQLRADLLMLANDRGISNTFKDPCRTVAASLDAAVRHNEITESRFENIFSEIDALHRKSVLIGDIAMVIRAPVTFSLIVRCFSSRLDHAVSNDIIPSKDTEVGLLLRLISLGASARTMLKDGVYMKFDTPDKEIFETFVPFLAERLLDDSIRVMQYTSEGAAEADLPAPEPLPVDFLKIASRNRIARRLCLQYATDRVRCLDVPVASLFFGRGDLQRKLAERNLTESGFLRSLIGALIEVHSPTNCAVLSGENRTIALERLRSVVFDHFLLEYLRTAALKSDSREKLAVGEQRYMVRIHEEVCRFLSACFNEIGTLEILALLHRAILGQSHPRQRLLVAISLSSVLKEEKTTDSNVASDAEEVVKRSGLSAKKRIRLESDSEHSSVQEEHSDGEKLGTADAASSLSGTKDTMVEETSTAAEPQSSAAPDSPVYSVAQEVVGGNAEKLSEVDENLDFVTGSTFVRTLYKQLYDRISFKILQENENKEDAQFFIYYLRDFL